MPGLMLLDSASMYFRAFYGVPESVTAPDGTPVNAVRGLIDMIATLLTRRRPDRLVACMDTDWRPAFRVAALPSYKAHRVGVGPSGDDHPPALARQVPIIEQVLDAVGLARVGAAGFEADDVIGTLATRDSAPVEVVSGDRDLFQLVDDAHPIRVLYIGKGVAKLEVIDEPAVAARYGIPSRHYADFATLRGDPSDGLPGVGGVGEKTAAALVARFGTVEAMLTALDDPTGAGFPAGSRLKIAAASDYLRAATGVVRVATDIDIPALADRVPTAPRDPDRLVELAETWNLDGPLNRLLNALPT